MPPRILLASGLLVLAGSVASPPGGDVHAQVPSYAGAWKLNARQSDNPQDRFRIAMEPVQDPRMERSFTSGGGGGGATGRPATRPGGAGGPPGGGRAGCTALGQLQRPPEDLRVEQTDSTIVVHAEECPPIVIFPDGRSRTEQVPGAGLAVFTHEVKGGKLQGERKYGETTTLSETYTLDQRKKQLVAEFRLNTPSLPRVLRMKLVYDLVEE
jgi:hypothetical protein